MKKKYIILASLSCMPRFGGVLYTKLIDKCNEIGMGLDEFYFLKESLLETEFSFLSRNFVKFFIEKRNETYFNVRNELISMSNDLNVSLISRDDPTYPKRLLKNLLEYAPPILYTYGNLSIFDEPSSAIIGTRKPSEVGRQICKNVSRETCESGKVVVSGYAKGIDYNAHYSALQNQGKTMFVIPVPLTRFNNAIMQDLANEGVEYSEIENNYLIVSEFLRNSRISYKSMPIIRNRCVAGLSDNIIIIEAGSNSGTMNTANTGIKLSIETKVIDFSYLSMKNPLGNSILIDNGCQRINPKKYIGKYWKKSII